MNVIDDLSTITSIPRANLTKLAQRIEWLICNAAYEASLSDDNTAEVVLGFGKLIIRLEDNQIKYRFQPSKKLENTIIEAYEKGIDPIAKRAEEAVVGTIMKAYKDLL